MQQLPISTTIPQAASTKGGSPVLGSDGKGALNGLDAAAVNGFSALLASQIRDALALLQPEGIGTGKAIKRLATGSDEALADPSATFAALPFPMLQSISVQVQMAGVTDKVAETGRPEAMPAALLPTGAATRDGAVAEFAAAGKDLPRLGAETTSGIGLTHALHGKGELPVAANEESHKLLVQVGVSDQARMDAGVSMAPLPVTTQPQLPAATVAPQVGAPGWGGAVGEKVMWMANQNHQVAELHLNPPNLGPLEVHLTVSNDQASAMFISPHPAVREAIEAALPRLREMLADGGIMLGNASVSQESFSQQQQAFGQAESGGQGRSDGRDNSDSTGQMTERGVVSRQSILEGAVDTFA